MRGKVVSIAKVKWMFYWKLMTMLNMFNWAKV